MRSTKPVSIYVMDGRLSENADWVTKIGISADPEQRARQLDCRLEFSEETIYARRAEFLAIFHMHKFRVHSEWFKVPPQLAIEAVRLCIELARAEEPLVRLLSGYGMGYSQSWVRPKISTPNRVFYR